MISPPSTRIKYIIVFQAAHGPTVAKKPLDITKKLSPTLFWNLFTRSLWNLPTLQKLFFSRDIAVGVMWHLCGPMCAFIIYFILHHDGTGKRLNRNIHQYTSSKIGKKNFWHEIIRNVVRSWEEWNGGGFNFRTFASPYLHSIIPLNQFLLFFLGKIIL